jgi:hypothetical protein
MIYAKGTPFSQFLLKEVTLQAAFLLFLRKTAPPPSYLARKPGGESQKIIIRRTADGNYTVILKNRFSHNSL